MVKGFAYTKEMDEKLFEYVNENRITLRELMQRCDLSSKSIFTFRRRKKIGAKSLRKIENNIGVKLF